MSSTDGSVVRVILLKAEKESLVEESFNLLVSKGRANLDATMGNIVV